MTPLLSRLSIRSSSVASSSKMRATCRLGDVARWTRRADSMAADGSGRAGRFSNGAGGRTVVCAVLRVTVDGLAADGGPGR